MYSSSLFSALLTLIFCSLSADAFGQLTGFPTSLLISREGQVCARYEGLADKTELERRIRALLQTNISESLGPGQ